MAARSSARRSDGRQRSVEWTRSFAMCSHDASWSLKSAGEVKRRPGRKLVSKYLLVLSTRPLGLGISRLADHHPRAKRSSRWKGLGRARTATVAADQCRPIVIDAVAGHPSQLKQAAQVTEQDVVGFRERIMGATIVRE